MRKILITISVVISLLIGIGIPFGVYGDDNIHLVMVPPFQVHSDEPLDYMAQSLPHMLSSRLDTKTNIKIDSIESKHTLKFIINSNLKIESKGGILSLNSSSGKRLFNFHKPYVIDNDSRENYDLIK